MATVKAISFDLWDTVFVDDSDERKRMGHGLPPKARARRDLVADYLDLVAPVPRALIDTAYDAIDEAFRKVWHEQHITWTVRDRLSLVLKTLQRELPDPIMAELVVRNEEMELGFKPELVPGIEQALRALHGRYSLVVISDAIFSPGWALRKLLDHYDLYDLFDGFVFSDEVGRSKPAPQVFFRAAALAGCSVDEMVHIGDREHNDIQGAHSVGALAVLVTAARDRGSDNTWADAVCHDYAALPGLLETLERKHPEGTP